MRIKDRENQDRRISNLINLQPDKPVTNMATQTASATTLYIPTPLRGFTENESAVEVNGTTVGDALDALVTRYPGLRDHLYDGEGNLRSFVNLYKNDDDVRYLEGEDTPLSAGDTLSIVPSIAGG